MVPPRDCLGRHGGRLWVLPRDDAPVRDGVPHEAGLRDEFGALLLEAVLHGARQRVAHAQLLLRVREARAPLAVDKVAAVRERHVGERDRAVAPAREDAAVLVHVGEEARERRAVGEVPQRAVPADEVRAVIVLGRASAMAMVRCVRPKRILSLMKMSVR